MTKRLAILAQYDPEGGLPVHVRLHLEGLRPEVDRLILVSNSPIDPASLATSETICDRVLVRENTGWDFAAWRDALESEDTDEFDWVILTNSSIIGPLHPLGPIFAKMESRTQDIWGMVMSRNKGQHLQSYFLSASSHVMKSKTWSAFWASVKTIDDKRKVIRDYEIGFSRAMSAGGFELAPLIEPVAFPKSIRLVNIERLKGRFKVPFSENHINRTVEFHEELILQGMPYLKASLLYGKDKYRFVGMDLIKGHCGQQYQFDLLTS